MSLLVAQDFELKSVIPITTVPYRLYCDNYFESCYKKKKILIPNLIKIISYIFLQLCLGNRLHVDLTCPWHEDVSKK